MFKERNVIFALVDYLQLKFYLSLNFPQLISSVFPKSQLSRTRGHACTTRLRGSISPTHDFNDALVDINLKRVMRGKTSSHVIAMCLCYDRPCIRAGTIVTVMQPHYTKCILHVNRVGRLKHL